jgi:hypothetical protein
MVVHATTCNHHGGTPAPDASNRTTTARPCAQPAATPGANAVPATKVVPPSTPPKTEEVSSGMRGCGCRVRNQKAPDRTRTRAGALTPRGVAHGRAETSFPAILGGGEGTGTWLCVLIVALARLRELEGAGALARTRREAIGERTRDDVAVSLSDGSTPSGVGRGKVVPQ